MKFEYVMPGVQTYSTLEGGDLITGIVQDCAPIREDAIARHNEGMHGSADMKHAARLPMEAVEKYLIANGITFEEFMKNPAHTKAMCNDPALRDFRIWPGRV
jgi:hypothetical protein